ncbi:MAG: 6-pyruvoyl-tetrahydropterin synthase-related protein [Patescibacteria group bacterium]
MNIAKKILPVVSILTLSLLAIQPFFHKEFFPIHDATQVARVFEMHQSLQGLMFPVRWVQDLGYGYGYPIFSFYAPLAYYLGAFFMFLGFSALLATKIMIALGVVLAGVTMYFFSKELFGEKAGVLSGVLYVFAPYHALNIYVRGAIGEVWAYAFIPLAFLGFLQIAKKPTWISISLAVGGLVGIIISHNLTALIVAPFLLVEIAVLFFRFPGKASRKGLLLGLILSFLISSWYTLPAVFEMGYTNVVSQTGGGSDYKDHFVCPSQLWSSQWGFGGSTSGCLDGLSFQIGKIHILLAAIGLSSVLFLKRKKERRIGLLLALGILVATLMVLPVTKPLWDTLSFMKYLQFPWRFLQIDLFFISLLGGFSVFLFAFIEERLKTKYSGVVILSLTITILGIAFFYTKLFQAQFFYDPYPDQTKKSTLNWDISRISDEYLPATFSRPHSRDEVPSLPYRPTETASVEILVDTPGQLILSVNAVADSHLILNRAYFPVWHITLDGHRASYAIGNGLYDVVIPEGSHNLTVVFEQTPLERVSNILSLVGIVLLVLGILLRRFTL